MWYKHIHKCWKMTYTVHISTYMLSNVPLIWVSLQMNQFFIFHRHFFSLVFSLYRPWCIQFSIKHDLLTQRKFKCIVTCPRILDWIIFIFGIKLPIHLCCKNYTNLNLSKLFFWFGQQLSKQSFRILIFPFKLLNLVEWIGEI